MNDNVIHFERTRDDALIPTKREEDGCYDLYASFPETYITINPHNTVMIPTGLKSAFSPRYRIALRERGSNIKTHTIVRAGQIDSGYRGEWFVGLTNDGVKPVIISKTVSDIQDNSTDICVPYTKAICQFAVEEVPAVSIEEVPSVDEFESERGTGKLGSSGK